MGGGDVGGGAGGSSSGGSTAFNRAGTSNQNAAYSLPTSLSSLISSQTANYGGSDDVGKSFLTKLVNNDSTLPGHDSLASAAAIDPFSTEYETSTQALFDNRLQKALATSRTGTENALAPLNRGKSFREAEVIADMGRSRNDDITRQRTVDSGIMRESAGQVNNQGISAANILNQIKGVNAAGLVSLAELLGSKSNAVTEDFTGQGSQNATGYSYGGGGSLNAGCCFIFLEVYNGKLPWWVRECRDEFYTPRMRSGYVFMSRWLVPAMQRSRVVRGLVNALLVQPLTKWGGWYKGVGGYASFGYLRPVVRFWFNLWTLIGGFYAK